MGNQSQRVTVKLHARFFLANICIYEKKAVILQRKIAKLEIINLKL